MPLLDFPGDNLQTAITVARNAGMIPQGSRVILVEAGAQPGQPSASVSWQELEEPSQEGSSRPEVSGPAGRREGGAGAAGQTTPDWLGCTLWASKDRAQREQPAGFMIERAVLEEWETPPATKEVFVHFGQEGK